ncbi:MAG TPA: MFS transporter [Steroidobacteraceae bacterium]|nr:MFS transporter [Steroidobacteraceae bacterium]
MPGQAVAWRVVASAALGVGAGVTGLVFYSFGLLIPALEESFGWRRAEIATGLLVLMFTGALVAPIAGRIVDRIGSRPVALVSLLLLAGGLAALSLQPGTLTVFYAGYFLIALGGAGTTPLVFTRAVKTWFDRRRGLALGLTLTGTGLAAALAPPYVTWVLTTYGLGPAYVALGLAVLLIAFPAVLAWFRERPLPSGGDATRAMLPGLTHAQARRDPKLYLIAIAILAISPCLGGLITQLPALLRDRGASAERVAAIVSLLGLTVLLARPLVGLLLDRVHARVVAGTFFAAPAIASLLLLGDSSSGWIAAALLIGLAAGAEVDLLAYLVSRYFGLREYGAIYAWPYTAFIVGAGLGPLLYGATFDAFGSYRAALLGGAALAVASSALMLLLGPYPAFGGEDRPGGALQN